MHVSRLAWVLFGILVLAALALDLGFLRSKRDEERQLSLRAAAIRNGAWVALSLLFCLGVLVVYGRQAALTYLTAYVLEQSLSIDNVFVFVVIFSAAGPVPLGRIPIRCSHRFRCLSPLVRKAETAGAGRRRVLYL